MIRHKLLFSSFLAGMAAVVFTAAQAQERAGQGDALRYQRIYAPVDRMPDWPTGHGKYLPLDAAEFARLLALARSGAADQPGAFVVQITAAEYRARLEGEKLLIGQAILDINHSGQSAAMLPLEPCNAAIRQAAWTPPDPNADPPTKKAILGLAPNGKLQVMVERAGKLSFEWSLSGQHDTSEATYFSCEFPACPAAMLLIDLPENLTPEVDKGIVWETEAAADGRRRWRVELGGQCRFRLRLMPSGASGSRPASVLLRESSVYELSPRGIDLSAQWKIQAHNEPLEKIGVLLDPGVQLVTARLGDMALPWTIEGPSGQAGTRAVLLLPEPIQDTERILRLGALAPLTLNRPFRLPRMQAEGLFWQDGGSTLNVLEPLVIERFRPIHCSQKGVGPIAEPNAGESLQFQNFSADAGIEVALSHPRAKTQLLSATAVGLGSREITARVAVDYRTDDTAQFTVEAELSKSWIVDAVESTPAEALTDWSVENQANDQQKLLLQLSKIPSRKQALRLVISARRLRTYMKRQWSVEELLPLRFTEPAENKRLAAIQAVGLYELKLSNGEQLTRLSARDLSAGELELFANPPGDLLFVDDAGATGAEITVMPQQPAYSGSVLVEADVSQERLQENYLLRCVPESTRVDRVLIHLSPSGEVPPRWTLANEGEKQLSARQCSKGEQSSAGLGMGGETWELTLRRPRSAPFEIRGTRETLLQGPQAVCLAALPEAANQRGTLVVRSSTGAGLHIENRRLKSIPPEPVPANQYSPVRATFHFDPVHDVALSNEPAVMLSAAKKEALPSIYVWHCRLESWYQARGEARHLASFAVENSGNNHLRIVLPSGVSTEDLRGAWVDDVPVAWQQTVNGDTGSPLVAEGEIVSLPLPDGKRFPTVSVYFTTHESGLRTFGSLRPPLPTAEAPALAGNWTVWLPPGYEIAAENSSGRAPQRPISSSRRLFGPLGRDPGEEVFHPLAAGDWVAFIKNRARARLAETCAGQVLETLGSAAIENRSGTNGKSIAWGRIIQPSSSGNKAKLLVDRRAMSELGIGPNSTVQSNSGDNPRTVGLSLLEKADLALLVHDDIVLLTGQFTAALYHSQLTGGENTLIWRVLPGPLAERLWKAAAAQEDYVWISADSWCRLAEESKPFWTGGDAAAWKPADTQGWITERLEITNSPLAQIKYVHRFGRQCWATLIFLLSLSLGYWRAARHPIIFTVMTGMVAVSVFVLPEIYVPLASAAVLGTLACLLIKIIQFYIKGKAPTPAKAEGSLDVSLSSAGKTASAAGQAGAMLLMLGAPLFFSASAKAEESTEKPPPAEATEYRVFVPIDAEKKPVGGKVYVPEKLFNELYRLAAKAKQEPQGWLLQSAVYRGSLVREAATGRLTPEVIKAQFDLQVFGRMVRVRLPFRRENAELMAESVTLDNRPVPAAWDSDGAALSFDVEEPGIYRLELALQPKLRASGTWAGFEMSIPRLAQSRLELMVPAEEAKIEAPSAIGAAGMEADPSRLMAELGPSNRLAVRWPENSASGLRKSALDIDQFVWVKVQSGSVVVDVRCKFHILVGQIIRLQLAADPRLRLLPVQGKDPPTVDVRSEYAQPQIITLQWNRSLSGEAALDLSFLLTGASGVGKFRLPEIKLLDAPAIKRWLAVSVDSMLEFESQQSPDLEPISTAEFLKSWGSPAAAPLQAYRLGGENADWSFSTRPREAETAAGQTLALSFDQSSVEANFSAQLTVAAGYVFQYQLAAPAAMQVTRVSVQKDGAEQAARWSQDPGGTITIFLKGPAEGKQQLSLHGLIPLENKEKIPLPDISLQRCRVQSSTLHVYRRPAVQLELTVPETVKSMPNANEEPDLKEQGRGVQTFRVEGPGPLEGEVRLRANRPNIQARQVTRLRQEGEQWLAAADFQLDVSDGVADQFWIDVPDTWKEPYEVDPPATVKVVQIPGERRRLLVQPRFAVTGAYRLSISGALEFKPGEAPAAPDVYLRKSKGYSRWLILPRQQKEQLISWKIHGLRPADLPASMANPGEEKNNFIYEIVNETPSATLRARTAAPRTAKVHLAAVRLAWQADGLLRGAATLDMEPGGKKFCPLFLPKEYELLSVSIDGMPVEPVSIGVNQWQLPLVSDRLPQRIGVVFRGDLSRPLRGGLWKFSGPSLGDLPVKETLWTVASPAALAPEIGKGQNMSTLEHQQWIRLHSGSEMIISGAELLQLDDAEETLHWYQLQTKRMTAARSMLLNEMALAPASESTQSLKKEIETIDQQQNECAQRIGLSNVLTQAMAKASASGEPAECWQQGVDESDNVVRYAIEGLVAPITINYQLVEQMRLSARIFAVLCLSGVVYLFGLGVRHGTWISILNERPYAAGIAAGLAWWQWLWPSFLGLALVLVCIVSWWRTRGRKTAEAVPAQESS